MSLNKLQIVTVEVADDLVCPSVGCGSHVPELDVNVVAISKEPKPTWILHHFQRTGSQAGHDVAQGMVVFVEEDVAGRKMRRKPEDGQADGFSPFHVM
jgi:hypothetical protein